jgi:hypothetical protein
MFLFERFRLNLGIKDCRLRRPDADVNDRYSPGAGSQRGRCPHGVRGDNTQQDEAQGLVSVTGFRSWITDDRAAFGAARDQVLAHRRLAAADRGVAHGRHRHLAQGASGRLLSRNAIAVAAAAVRAAALPRSRDSESWPPARSNLGCVGDAPARFAWHGLSCPPSLWAKPRFFATVDRSPLRPCSQHIAGLAMRGWKAGLPGGTSSTPMAAPRSLLDVAQPQCGSYAADRCFSSRAIVTSAPIYWQDASAFPLRRRFGSDCCSVPGFREHGRPSCQRARSSFKPVM